MAKRTPRTEADDTTSAPANRDLRTPDPRTGRSRTARETEGTATEEKASRAADPFAARPDDHVSREYAPTEDEIRYRAYLLYVERGGGHGMDFEDWLRAERELKNRNR
jgi:Protein of unknown function (DUF2934)